MYWIIDNRADIVAMLMDPISYATQVLKEMDEDLVSCYISNVTIIYSTGKLWRGL